MLLYKKFRFDFSGEVTEMLSNFSKEHCDEKRKQFQESWKEWISLDKVKIVLDTECKTLRNEGFDGDVLDKMYKSARYYYKKREMTPQENRVKNVSVVHTNRFSSNFLISMDTVINEQLMKDINESNAIDKSQVDYFHSYCNIHTNEIVMELRRIKETKGEIPEDIKTKLKKTYKNRFYKNRINIIKE